MILVRGAAIPDLCLPIPPRSAWFPTPETWPRGTLITSGTMGGLSDLTDRNAVLCGRFKSFAPNVAGRGQCH
jgi:hypothetical protein